MNSNKSIVLFGVVLSLCVGIPQISVAAPGKGKVTAAARLARNSVQAERRLDARLNGLTPDQVNAVIGLLAGTPDSDSDGVPDVLEPEGGICDSDRDDDGINDGDEYDDGNDPDDDDSDDDGYDDSDEEEVHATISAISNSQIELGGKVFLFDSGTVFLSKRKQALTQADFVVGECVEVEGHSEGGSLVADKVKEDDDC